MSNSPEGVYALTAAQKLELALALMGREHRDRDGRDAFRTAYPSAPEEMVSTAAFHVYTDGAPAVVAFLADAELFLRDPDHRMHLGVTYEVLYHIYNWMQFRELLPDGRQHILELLAELKQFVEEDDRAAIRSTAQELEDALGGSRDYPQFE
jgi:hypothetical protein